MQDKLDNQNPIDNIINCTNDNDMLHGTSTNDQINGLEGDDQLTGGAGNDIFVFFFINESLAQSPDKINDFKAGKDKIDLSYLKIIDDKKVEIKKVDSFTRQKNESLLDYNKSTNNTNLILDHDGDRQKELEISTVGKFDFEQDI